MSPQYDAFGRPVEPSAPRPEPESRPSGRSYGAPESPRHRREDDSGSVPEVRGLPPVDGGAPVRGTTPGRRRSWGNALGAFGAAAIIGLGILGSLGEDDDGGTARSGGSSSATPEDAPLTAPVTAASADRAVATLRRAVRPTERVLSVSVSGGSATVRVTTPGGGNGGRYLSLDEDGSVRTFESSTTSARSPGIPVAELDAAAPGRMVAAVLRGLGPRTTGSVRSVSAYVSGDEPLRWTASAQGVRSEERSWSGDEHGRAVVRTRDGAPAPEEGESGPAVVPAGLQGRSLLVTANLRSALGALRTLPALRGRSADEVLISSLNVQPDRVLAGIQDGSTRQLVSVDAAFGVDPSATSSSATGSVPLSLVDPAGPGRALRAIGRRASIDAAASVQYVALTIDDTAPAGEQVRWFIVLEDGADERIWRASIDGTRVGASGEDLTR